MDDVARLADRIFVMAAGKIVKEGTPREVYADEGFLKSIGLGAPRAAAFANRLALPIVPLTPEELLEALAP
jgi:energy-coupling factor transport system ATP-binding protein